MNLVNETYVASVDYVNVVDYGLLAWRTNRSEDYSVLATFSTAVSGFSATAISCSNGGTVTNFTANEDGSAYGFTVRLPADTAYASLKVGAPLPTRT